MTSHMDTKYDESFLFNFEGHQSFLWGFPSHGTSPRGGRLLIFGQSSPELPENNKIAFQ